MYLLTFELWMSWFTARLTLDYTLPESSICIYSSVTNAINCRYTVACFLRHQDHRTEDWEPGQTPTNNGMPYIKHQIFFVTEFSKEPTGRKRLMGPRLPSEMCPHPSCIYPLCSLPFASSQDYFSWEELAGRVLAGDIAALDGWMKLCLCLLARESISKTVCASQNESRFQINHTLKGAGSGFRPF